MNPSSSFPLCGLILAGGRSSRMGRDKAALIHPDGRTLVRRCHDLLLEAGCEMVVISLRHEQEIPPGLADLEPLQIIRDPAGESLGPMVGMVTGMSLRPAAHWLVLACDLPRLDSQTLSHLITSINQGEKFIAYRSEFDNLPEPLCTLYTHQALPILKQAQADDLRCPRKILIRNDCRLLEPVSPRALDNANTPQDWETAIRP
jgi:molybdopterin-guanine dinucleotide biosynthesis protein A